MGSRLRGVFIWGLGIVMRGDCQFLLYYSGGVVGANRGGERVYIEHGKNRRVIWWFVNFWF